MDRHARLSAGLTLAELLTTIAVLAITVTAGVPAFTGLAQRAREANSYHLLTTSLAGARVAAVSAGIPVTVCPSSDGATCRQDLVWDDGWIVYADPGRSAQPKDSTSVLHHVEAPGPGVALRSTRGRHRVRFTRDGWSYGSNLSIRVCSTRDAALLGKVVVNNAGRTRSERERSRTACPFSS